MRARGVFKSHRLSCFSRNRDFHRRSEIDRRNSKDGDGDGGVLEEHEELEIADEWCDFSFFFSLDFMEIFVLLRFL